MAALRFAPLLALPILGGVLLAFVIATFEGDPEVAPQAASIADEELEPQVDPVVEEATPQPTVEPQVITEAAPPEPADPLDEFDVGDLFNLDDFSTYWRGNLPPDLADILENGFPGRGN